MLSLYIAISKVSYIYEPSKRYLVSLSFISWLVFVTRLGKGTEVSAMFYKVIAESIVLTNARVTLLF